LALKTSTSGEYRIVEGQLKRAKKFLVIRGLNANHNHDLKNIFKSAATWAAAVPGPSTCYCILGQAGEVILELSPS